MSLYLTEIARIGGALLMALYAILSFVTLLYRTEKKRMWIYVTQAVLMAFIQFALFLQMIIKTGDMTYLFFFAFQAIIILATIVMHRLIYPDGNLLIVNNMCLLLMISMAVLTRLSGNQAIRQFIIVVASIIVALCVPALIHMARKLPELQWVYAIVGLLPLLVVLILGSAINGSNINYSIGGLTFQPSEFVKIIFVFYVAAALAKTDDFLSLVAPALIAGLYVAILVLSKDLGAGLIFYIAFILMLYIARDRIFWLIFGTGMGAAACVVAYRLFPHVRNRVAAFLDPWSAIEGAGYQVAQSLFGISLGGPFGLGLYGGKPEAIPFVSKDFIFSAISEELGIVFAVSLLAVCLSTGLMILTISGRIRDPFYRLLTAGFGVIYLFQVFLTVGGGTKFIPLTGVTLPLVSYGGSSVLSTILMFGILQGVMLIRADEHRTAVERLMNDREAYDRVRREKNRRKNERADRGEILHGVMHDAADAVKDAADVVKDMIHEEED